jgi:hypothetical protein
MNTNQVIGNGVGGRAKKNTRIKKLYININYINI